MCILLVNGPRAWASGCPLANRGKCPVSPCTSCYHAAGAKPCGRSSTTISCAGTFAMSFQRRRIFGQPSPEPSRQDSPDQNEEVRLVPLSKLRTLTTKKSKRRNGLIFGLGGLFGIVIAAFFANQQDVISLNSLMELNLEGLLDVIPAGIVQDVKDISVCSSCKESTWSMLKLISFSAVFSNMNAIRSIMTRFLWVCTFSRKV